MSSKESFLAEMLPNCRILSTWAQPVKQALEKFIPFGSILTLARFLAGQVDLAYVLIATDKLAFVCDGARQESAI